MIDRNVLASFTGSEHHHRHMSGFKYTDGIKYVAEEAGAYWLLDLIFGEIRYNAKVQKDFTCWKLSVKDSKAVLICDDGNDNILYERKIRYTDFPLDNIEVWYECGVLLLPSEH